MLANQNLKPTTIIICIVDASKYRPLYYLAHTTINDLGYEVVDRECIHHSSLSSQLWRIILGQSHLLIRDSSIKSFQIQQKHDPPFLKIDYRHFYTDLVTNFLAPHFVTVVVSSSFADNKTLSVFWECQHNLPTSFVCFLFRLVDYTSECITHKTRDALS